MDARLPDIPPPVRDTHAPRWKFPAKACDSHAHIFGPASRFAILPDTHFVPHECPLADYLRMLRIIGCERAVLVQPSVYGTDNTAISEALQSGEFELRGVAVVREDVTDKQLEDLHAQGFRGIRINTASATPGLRLEHAPGLAQRIRHLGWHLQFFVDLEAMPELEPRLAALPVDLVIDHFGRVAAAGGVEAPAFRALLRLLGRDHCWGKLTGPYFLSGRGPAFADVAALARAMVEVAPDRLVWGTDWPHPSARAQMPNDGDLADMLASWVPDSAARTRILVDNPARLYGFG